MTRRLIACGFVKQVLLLIGGAVLGPLARLWLWQKNECILRCRLYLLRQDGVFGWSALGLLLKAFLMTLINLIYLLFFAKDIRLGAAK